MNSELEFLKSEIAYFMKRLYRKNLTTTLGGNMSVRTNRFMVITPSQKDKDRLSAEDMAIVDIITGEILTSQKPSMEYRFHQKIYEIRDEIGAIIHAHPFWGTWLAITNCKPDIHLLDESAYFLKHIAFCNYAPMGTEALAKEVADKITTSDILILKNHGVITTGNKLCEALEKMEVLENIAHYTFLINQQK